MDVIIVKYQIHPEEAIPKRVTYKDMFHVMRERKSCRSYQNKKLSAEDLGFVKRIIDEEITDANAIAEFGDGIKFMYADGHLNVWPVVNATEAGIATCWIGPGADHRSIAKLLGKNYDEKKHHILCVCAIGYASKYVPLLIRGMSARMRRRHPLETLFLYDDVYSQNLIDKEKILEVYGEIFKACQWAPSSFNAQPTRCLITRHGSSPRFDFFTIKESRHYSPVAAGIWLANWELGCYARGIKGDFTFESPSESMKQDDGYQHYEVSWIENQ